MRKLLHELDARLNTSYAVTFQATAARTQASLAFTPMDVGLGDGLLRSPEPVYLHPLQYDQHLQRASNLLNECLATRRTAQDIEASIVTFLSQVELHRSLQSPELRAEMQRIRSAVGAQQAARLVGLQEMKRCAEGGLEALPTADGGSGLPLPAVRAALAVVLAAIERDLATESHSAAVQEAVEGLTARNLAAIDEHQERLLSRFREHGSGYNLIQRLERLQRAFIADLFEAFHLLRAADDGLRRVFRLAADDPQMPRFPTRAGELDLGALDVLVAWCRQAIEKLRVETARDVSTTLRVSLRQPWDDAGIQRILADDPKFKEGVTNGVLTFEVPGSLFEAFDLTFVRLQRIGLAFVTAADEEKRLASFIVQLELPAQEHLAGSHQRVGEVLLGGVRTNDGEPFVQGTNERAVNASPIGRYTARINKQSARSVKPTTRAVIDDVVLELTVVGRRIGG